MIGIIIKMDSGNEYNVVYNDISTFDEAVKRIWHSHTEGKQIEIFDKKIAIDIDKIESIEAVYYD